MAEMLPAGKRPATTSLAAAEEALLKRLDTIQLLRDRLAMDFGVYQAQQLELDELRTQARESVRLGRITLILWARSHQNLAAGVAVPAAIDVMGMVRGAATKAAAFP
jgi:DNA-binding protein